MTDSDKTNSKGADVVDLGAARANGTSTPHGAGIAQPTMPKATGSIDIARLRLSQDFSALAPTLAVLASVPVTKPPKTGFVRVHPDGERQLQAMVLHLKDAGEFYLIDPDIQGAIAEELTPMVLFQAVTREGQVFIWPVPLPGPDGRHNPWHKAALIAAETAKTRWVRVTANMGRGSYDVRAAVADYGEPEWPEKSFHELLNFAFGDKFIASLDHPVLRKLRGEE